WSRKQRAWGGCVAWAPGCRSRCPAGTWYWRGRARRHALGVTAGLRNGHSQRGGAPDAAFGLIRATRLARRHAWALPLGCVMDISSVAGPRMRPLALSGLRGWRVATRGRYRWAAQWAFPAWRGPGRGLRADAKCG